MLYPWMQGYIHRMVAIRASHFEVMSDRDLKARKSSRLVEIEKRYQFDQILKVERKRRP